MTVDPLGASGRDENNQVLKGSRQATWGLVADEGGRRIGGEHGVLLLNTNELPVTISASECFGEQLLP